ncbi:hypothetical protein FOL47_001859 [Perkinsus chesapeaki]|uniref:Ribosomal RNA-processing protein 12-like conserved domain-containing protein n=1 Tax=Perkinsus chesapeaki TaxID=330153 RepID=A0A7J6MHN5_PERCH|nr:hypothetical protein FOL47_001859 [Perkinsus chesapeaki]
MSTVTDHNVVHVFLGALAEAATAFVKGQDSTVQADKAAAIMESLNNATVKPQWATLLFPVLEDLLKGLRKELDSSRRIALLNSHPVWGALIDFVFNTAVLSGTTGDLLSAVSSYRRGVAKKSSPANTTKAAVDAGVELILTFSISPVLRVAPLKIVSSGTAEDPAARLWRLLGSKDTSETAGGCGCQLSDWVNMMLPAAVFVNGIAKSNESADPTRARKLFTVVEQLWEVLPSMLDGCVDMPGAFTMQNSILGKTLLGAATTHNQRTPEVQESALRSLRVFGEECSRQYTDRKAVPKELLAIGDKFINPLCSMYMGEGSVKVRDLVVEAITAVAKSGCSVQVLQTVFTNVTKQLIQESQKPNSTEVVSDLSELCLALLPAVPASGRQLVVGKVFTPLMKNSSAPSRLQKAAYRAIRIAVEAGDFSNLDSVQTLLGLLNTVPSSAQTIKHRLLLTRSLMHSVEGNEEQQQAVMAALIPEAMVATRDPGAQVRVLGWALLTDVCRRCSSSYNSLLALINIVCAGLAGSSIDMVCASVETLGLVVEQCWPVEASVSAKTASNPFAVSGGASSESTQKVALLREVVKTVLMVRADGKAIEKPLFKSLLLFARSCLRVGDGLNNECLEMYTKLTLSAEGRSQMQMKMGMRRLMEKLGKRVGWAELAAATPEEHRPLVKHVQKQLERERRRRIMERAAAGGGDKGAAEVDVSESSDDDDEDDERRHVTRGVKGADGKGGFVIDENGEEPLDLLGRGGQKGVKETTSMKGRRKVNEGNRILKEEDGKIIVEAPEEPTTNKKPEMEDAAIAIKKKGLGRLAEIRAAKKGARRARLQHEVKGLDQCAPGSKNRGSGDAQRQSAALQPYAYVRLNPKLVKEKFKSESIRSIDRVVKAGEEEKKKARLVSKKSKLSISKGPRGKRRR